MQNSLQNTSETNSDMLPSLNQIRCSNSQNLNNSNNLDATELTRLPSTKKKFNLLDLNTIITIERILEILLKIVIVVFIGIILCKQITFFKDLILGVATNKYTLDSTTLQIVSTALIVEFIFAMKIVINSLFPESDRKNSLDFIKNEKLKGI